MLLGSGRDMVIFLHRMEESRNQALFPHVRVKRPVGVLAIFQGSDHGSCGIAGRAPSEMCRCSFVYGMRY